MSLFDKKAKIYDASSMRELFSDVIVACGYMTRLRGLTILEENPGPSFAMYFPRCSRVHMRGMRVGLDIIALDRDGKVLGIDSVLPNEKVKHHRGSKSILEAKMGACDGLGISVGDILYIAIE